MPASQVSRPDRSVPRAPGLRRGISRHGAALLLSALLVPTGPLFCQHIQWRALLPSLLCGSDSSLYSVHSEGRSAYACGEDGAAYRSTDGGASFHPMQAGGKIDLYEIRFTSPSRGHICGDSGSVARTTDGGNSWLWTRLAGLESKALYAMEWANDSVGYIAGGSTAVAHGNLDLPGGIILRSTDGGANWSTVLEDANVFFWSLAVVHSRSDSTIAFCSQYGPLISGGVRSSRDGGRTWSTDAQGWPFLPHDISIVSIDDAISGFACGGNPFDLSAQGYIACSADGWSWQVVRPLPEGGFAWCAAVNTSGDSLPGGSERTWYVGLQSGVVLASDDSGATWSNSAPSAGLPSDCPIYDLSSPSNSDSSGENPERGIYAAGSGRGLFRGILSGSTDSGTPSVALPSSSHIDVFPNPVPSTAREITIRFLLPRPSRCRLTVIDAHGRIVQTEKIDAGLRNARAIFIGNLGPGFYCVQMCGDAVHAEKQFVLLR